MQYLAWPDHGVPDDSSDFLSFVMRVRQNRTGMVEPTVVHCRWVLDTGQGYRVGGQGKVWGAGGRALQVEFLLSRGGKPDWDATV